MVTLWCEVINLLRSVAINYKDHDTGLYRSSSQTKDKLNEFCLSFNMLMSNINDEKPLVSIITVDF